MPAATCIDETAKLAMFQVAEPATLLNGRSGGAAGAPAVWPVPVFSNSAKLTSTSVVLRVRRVRIASSFV